MINPAKSELGIVTKHLVDEINSTLCKATALQQWRDTSSVLSWFNSLEYKHQYKFLNTT